MRMYRAEWLRTPPDCGGRRAAVCRVDVLSRGIPVSGESRRRVGC